MDGHLKLVKASLTVPVNAVGGNPFSSIRVREPAFRKAATATISLKFGFTNALSYEFEKKLPFYTMCSTGDDTNTTSFDTKSFTVRAGMLVMSVYAEVYAVGSTYSLDFVIERILLKEPTPCSEIIVTAWQHSADCVEIEVVDNKDYVEAESSQDDGGADADY
jgi:hypothetical protein